MALFGIGDTNRMLVDVPARYVPILGLPEGSTQINIKVSRGKGRAKAKDDAARALLEYGIPYQAALSLVGEDYEILDDSKDPRYELSQLEELSPEEVAEGRGRTGMPTGVGTPTSRGRTWSIGDQTVMTGLGQEKGFWDKYPTEEGLGAGGGIGGTVAADPSDFPAFAAALDQSGGLPPVVPPAVVPPAVVPPAVAPPAVAPPAVAPPAVAPPAVAPPTVWGATDRAAGFADVPPPVVPPAVLPPVAVANAAAAQQQNEVVTVDPATGLPVLTSRELSLDPFMERAGQRLALRNVFGEQATGVGPLSGYLQRQLSPLTSAFRGGAWEDMARGFAGDRDLALAGLGGTAEGPTQFDYGLPSMGGDAGSAVELPGTGLPAALAAQAATEVGGAAVPAAGVAGLPGYSFEDYLRTTREQPTGLGGAYGQALQNVGYLRGLGQGGIPPALAGILNPEQAAGTRDARSLLGAAQKGRYSGLVSRAFRRPSEEDLFADYVLARQDATTAGQTPQNFLGFAASRYGL